MKEKTTKTTIFGPNLFDLIGTEQWLSDMAKEGWLFDKFSPFFSVRFSVRLKKEEPKPNRRYRFITNDMWKVGPDEEQVDTYAASGWNFADTYREFSLFYNDNPDAPEIFSEEKDFKKNTRKYFWILAGILLWSIIYFARFIKLFSYNSLHLMEDENVPTIILEKVILVLCIIVVGVLAAEIVSGMMRAHSVNQTMNRDKPYKVSMVIHAINKMLFVLWAFLMIISIIVSFVPNSKTTSVRDLSKYEGTHPVTLEEIDPDNAILLQEIFNDYGKHFNRQNECTLTTKSSSVFSEKTTLVYHVDYDGTKRIWFTSHYGEFKDVDNAIPYILEELEYIDPNLRLEDIRIPSDTVDYLGYYMDIEPDYISLNQYVFAQKGNKIAIGEYRAGVEEGALLNPDEFLDLKPLAHLFAEDLNEG